MSPCPSCSHRPKSPRCSAPAARRFYTMIERAQFPGVTRIGRRVLVRQDALLDWLRHQKSTPSLER